MWSAAYIKDGNKTHASHQATTAITSMNKRNNSDEKVATSSTHVMHMFTPYIFPQLGTAIVEPRNAQFELFVKISWLFWLWR
jgi:hypothetical protein